MTDDVKQQRTGAMIALVPTVQDAARLAVIGGEDAAELHSTLVYLGKAADITEDARAQIIDAVRAYAGTRAPVEAEGFAVAVFNPGSTNDAETCIVLGLSGDQLCPVHDAVLSLATDAMGSGMPKQHAPHIPHLTLVYTDDADQVAAFTDRVGPVVFDRIRVAFADEYTDVPLGDAASALPGEPAMGPSNTVAAVVPVAREYHRDGHGRFADHDSLGLGDRIELENGEHLAGSAQAEMAEGSEQDVLLAVTRTAGVPALRLGFVSDDEDSESGEDWSGGDNGNTVRFDATGINRFLTALDDVSDAGIDWENDSRDLWDAHDADPDNADVQARFDAWDGGATIASGVIPGAWGGIAYEVVGTDDGNLGWEVRMAIRPTDAGDDWAISDSARFDEVTLGQLREQIEDLLALGDNTTTNTDRQEPIRSITTPSGADRTDMGRATHARVDRRARAKTWFQIENKADTSAADVYIYSDIGMWGITASDFTRELRDITAPTIELHLNSPGGDVFEGVAIFNALRSHKATVNVTVDGLAASIASVIAMAGDMVTMGRGSQMMIHDGHAGIVGNAKVAREMAEMLDRTSNDIASFYAERAGGTAEHWRDLMRAETWYTAEEAVNAGLADQVAPSRSRERVDAMWDLSIFNYAGRDAAPSPTTRPALRRPAAVAAARDARPATPAPVPVFDPQSFRASITAASEPMPHFDPDLFRHALNGLAYDAPAVPAPRPVAVHIDPEPEPVIVAEVQVSGPMPHFDPGAWRNTFNGLAMDAPAVPVPVVAQVEVEPDPEPEPEPVAPVVTGPMPHFSPMDWRGAFDGLARDAPAVPVPVTQAAVAEPEPEPELEPGPVVDGPMPHFDPGTFLDTMQGLAIDAPAVPEPEPVAVASEAPAVVPEPEPIPEEEEPGAFMFRPSVFRAALQLAANSVPAVPDLQPPAPAPAAEPAFPPIDPKGFERSLREARI